MDIDLRHTAMKGKNTSFDLVAEGGLAKSGVDTQTFIMIYSVFNPLRIQIAKTISIAASQIHLSLRCKT